MHDSTSPQPLLHARPNPPQEAIRRLSSADLLNGGNEIIIDHGQSQYRLRMTRQGKLILTK